MSDPEQPRLRYLSCVAETDRDALLEALGQWGYTVLEFDGSSVTSGQDLWAETGSQFSMSASMQPKSWDGLRDALFEAFTNAGPGRVALVWDQVDALVTGDLQDFILATSIIEGLAVDCRRAGLVEVNAFLVGRGDGYRAMADIGA